MNTKIKCNNGTFIGKETDGLMPCSRNPTLRIS